MLPPRPKPEENSNSPEPLAPIDPVIERDLRAFIGNNADYYLRAWRPFLSSEKTPGPVNYAAFLISGFWFGYRRMYRELLILFVIAWALGSLEAVLNVPTFSIFSGLPLWCVCGACGNRWYFYHARRTIRKCQALGLEENAYLAQLAKRGGTSVLEPIFMVIFVGVLCYAGNTLLFAVINAIAIR